MKPVVILGGGINGAALARELTLNRIPVHLIDLADIASGSTAYSSRLIHGGLRYLEYGDFRLVRESLEERKRLLHLAQHLVKPLCLHIPSTHRLGGFWSAAKRMIGLKAKSKQRGSWLVRMGLSLYDRYASDKTLPKHSSMRSGDKQAISLDAKHYPYQSSYWDGQVHYAERLVVCMLEDARRAAKANNVEFSVIPYGESTLQRRTLFVRYVRGNPRHKVGAELAPSMIVNATGAWLDFTLRQLDVPQESRLMGGTAGSHFLTANATLKERLGGKGLYAEAKDGRPFFVLPFGQMTLIGTTDIVFEGDPRTARASDAELTYLLDSVNEIFDGLRLTQDEIAWHYCGVRPLPYTDSKDPGAITRDHKIIEHPDAPVPLVSLVGGKLTTARALAEETADLVMKRLKLSRVASTESRPLPGAARLVEGLIDAATERARIVEATGHSQQTVDALWSLYGDESGDVLESCQRSWPENTRSLLPGSHLPEALVRYAVHNEWAHTIDDVMTRRLMMHFQAPLQGAAVQRIAEILSEEDIFPSAQVAAQVTACRNALADRYGLIIG